MNIHIFPQLPLVFVGFPLIVIWLLKKQGRTQVFFKNTTYIKGDHLKNPLILNKSRRKEFTATLVKSSSSWVAGVVTGRWWWWHDAGGGVQLSNVAVKWLKLVPQVPLRTIYYAPWPPKHHFGTCTIFLKPLYILLCVCMWNTCPRLVHSTYIWYSNFEYDSLLYKLINFILDNECH